MTKLSQQIYQKSKWKSTGIYHLRIILLIKSLNFRKNYENQWTCGAFFFFLVLQLFTGL